MRAQITSFFGNNQFTCLCFTNGLVNPVLFVIIIAESNLQLNGVLRFNPITCNIDDPSTMELIDKNICGADKTYPCGSFCLENGIEILCMVSCTPFGSITSKLLAEGLSILDESGLLSNAIQLPR